MLNSILSILGMVFNFAIGVFVNILTQGGVLPVFLGVFGAFCVYRFIIAPLTSGGGMKKGGSKDNE